VARQDTGRQAAQDWARRVRESGGWIVTVIITACAVLYTARH
jgi:hypothetical protein